MLEKLPGVASADADKATRSATVVYDKSVFDVYSVGDEGRYKFELIHDSAQSADADTEADQDREMSGSDNKDADSSAMDSDQSQSQSMIKIEDRSMTEGSDAKAAKDMAPTLEGPSS